MSVCHEVPVLALFCFPFFHPCPLGIVEEEVLRFVNEGPSVLCKNAVLELTDFAFLHVCNPALSLHVAVKTVKGSECSLEILLLLHAWLPCKEAVSSLDLKVVLCELTRSLPVSKDHLGCGDFYILSRLADLVCSFWVISFRSYK